MKYLFSLLCIALFLSGCGAKKNYDFASAEVVMISQEGYETITLRSTGYGNDKNESLYNAEKLAFENIFFRGIPNSKYSDPLIGINENKKTAEYKNYFDSFYEQRMRTFIVSSYQSTPFQKQKGTHITTVDLKINMKSLKKDLQDNGLVRKFGF